MTTDLFEIDLESSSPPLKSHDLVEACRDHRNRTTHQSSPIVIDDDREMAEKIRAYYRAQYLMMMMETTGSLSKFQTDVYMFVNEHFETMSSQNRGLVARLPEFYEYDQAIESMKKEATAKDIQNAVQYLGENFKKPIPLTHTRTLYRNTKKYRSTEYWFNLVGQQCPVRLAVGEATSPGLKSLFEHYFKSNETIYVTGLADTKQMPIHPDFFYVSVGSWDLVLD